MNERLNENGCGNALAVLEKEKESPFAQLQIRDRPADRPLITSDRCARTHMSEKKMRMK